MALVATFASIGWQVQRLIDDRPWSNPLMWATVAVGIVVGLCVLAWTWAATENARRIVGPAARDDLPDPAAALRTWIIPFAFVGVAVAVVAVVGARTEPSGDQTVSALPLAVAVLALLLAIPMTYRPMHYLAGVVRQVGGYTVRVSQWMWVPVVMGLVGIASIVALRYAPMDDVANSGSTDATDWAPLWVVAVVAIAPCVVVVLLAWRAASSVEDAIVVASSRRRPGSAFGTPAPKVTSAPKVTPAPKDVRKRTQARRATAGLGGRIDLLPGADLLRLTTVTLLAGAALLSMVGAIVTGMLWIDSRDFGVLPAERQRAWDALQALEAASRGVTIAMLAAVSAWTFVTVLNIRMTSGRRRNPLIAAMSWPAAAAAVWWIADNVISDASIGRVVLGFVAQAAALAVPFLVLERSADAIGARRTPLRIVYVLTVVLLVHVQGLGGLARLPESISTTEIGRLTGYLAIGALIQLCSTLAVTDACRGMSRACRHEADHHNMLVEQQETRARGRAAAAGR